MSPRPEFWIVLGERVFAARESARGVEYRRVTNGREHWRLRPYLAADQRFATQHDARIAADAFGAIRRSGGRRRHA